MSDSADDPRLARIERGLDALFATEVAKEVLEAVDFEAILADEPAEDPVDVERLADAIGRPVGRVLARRVVDGSGASGLAKRSIGGTVGSRVAAATLRVVVENVDTGAVAETLLELDESTPGPSLREAVETDLDDARSVPVTTPDDAGAVDVEVTESGPDAGGAEAAGDSGAGADADAEGSDGAGDEATDVETDGADSSADASREK